MGERCVGRRDRGAGSERTDPRRTSARNGASSESGAIAPPRALGLIPVADDCNHGRGGTHDRRTRLRASDTLRDPRVEAAPHRPPCPRGQTAGSYPDHGPMSFAEAEDAAASSTCRRWATSTRADEPDRPPCCRSGSPRWGGRRGGRGLLLVGACGADHGAVSADVAGQEHSSPPPGFTAARSPSSARPSGRFGWSAKFVDFDDLDAVAGSPIDEDTRAILRRGAIRQIRAATSWMCAPSADIADAAGLPLNHRQHHGPRLNLVPPDRTWRHAWSCIRRRNT